MSLLDRIFRSAREYPEKEVLSDEAGQWDYAGLFAHALAVQRALEEAGIQSGKRVAILAKQARPFAGSFLGILLQDATPVPLNWLVPDNKMRLMQRDASIEHTLVAGEFETDELSLQGHLHPFSDLASGVNSAKERKEVFDAVEARIGTFDGGTVEEMAVLLYTSGTTAAPKGVRLSHRNLIANIEGCRTAMNISPEDCFFSALPLFHSFALTCGLLLPLSSGARVHLESQFHPRSNLEAMRDVGATVYLATASQYRALTRCMRKMDWRYETPDGAKALRCFSGGEPLPSTTREAFEEVMRVPLLEGYGLTETSPVISVNRPGENRPGTVGKPLHNVEVRIAPEEMEGGRRSVEGEGEIQVKGPSVTEGYLNRPEESKQLFTEDGWLKTGDIGRLDEDGFLLITDRKKNIIISAGENIPPVEIEEELLSLVGVKEAAVIGVPDERRGEVPVAYVAVGDDEEVESSTLLDALRERLPGFMVPRDLILLPELPRGPTGKVLKKNLTDYDDNTMHTSETAYTVLVIDDDENILNFVEEVFIEDGGRVLATPDPEEGIMMAGEEQVDLLLLDIRLPEMDGYEVFRVLKNQNHTADLPIVIITAPEVIEDSPDDFLDEVDGVKTKPLDREDLISCLEVIDR